jgi:hypothetical protein
MDDQKCAQLLFAETDVRHVIIESEINNNIGELRKLKQATGNALFLSHAYCEGLSAARLLPLFKFSNTSNEILLSLQFMKLSAYV